MKYKLIAIDLDGTLLTDDKRITDESISALKEIIERGYEIVIATGRRYWSAKRFVESIDENICILANNGNIVRNKKDDKILIKKYLNVEDFNLLVEEGKREGLYPVIHVDNYEDGYDMVIELDRKNSKYSTYLSDNVDRFRRVDDLLKMDSPKVLTVVYVGDKEKLESFNNKILEKYPGKYSSHVMENMTIAGALLEVMNPLGSKWLSLEEYGKAKGIKDYEMIAIGDDNNDVEMVKKAGLGIAMKNGSLKVKEAADIVTDKSNNEGGVACILKEVLNI
ncbi:Cof-type HAD-IIB family hydrolase [Sporanaerobacter acetigenes]|uniref:Cof-type HAD-IIB family hydrolase n=1 Tax=Sporanaerobacter acetigenes TaxID=165813 RepID=UPI003329102A